MLQWSKHSFGGIPVSLVKPSRLRSGDVIGLVAPSDSVVPHRAQVERGAARLEALGYRLRFGRNVWREHGMHAGTPAERLEDLHTLWADPAVKALLMIMGGSGCPQIVDKLDYGLIAANPKIFVGFSDGAMLINAIHARTGLVTFMGPDLANDLCDDPQGHIGDHLAQVLGQAEPAGVLPAWTGPVRVLRAGTAGGRPVVGPLMMHNVPVSTSLLGTPYWPDPAGSIFCVEAFMKPASLLMRSLVQLRLAGVLERVAALVLGQLEGCCTDFADPAEGLRWALEIGPGDLDIPVFAVDAFGHGVPNATMPIGVRAEVSEHGLKLLEAAVV